MPSKSKSQRRLMLAVAHGWEKPGGGPSQSVAKEFVKADKQMPKVKLKGLPSRVKRKK